ncbi:interferon alpha-7-like [Esox lucius]|uniref:interferon alpha-7-like n=1 Tax=Esox lucius TaxID=8010 RepID=UPI0009733178|nr:interferon alpha-7-like [Esox lucius]
MAAHNVTFVVHLLFALALYRAVYGTCCDETYYIFKTRQVVNDLAMGRKPVCVQEAARIRVHRPTLSLEVGERFWTLSLVFHLACELFQRNLTLVKWNVNQLRELQELLARQNRTYSACVKDIRLGQSLPNETIVKKYFKQLDDFLSRETFSLCAWEVVRFEMGRILRDFHKKSNSKKTKYPCFCNKKSLFTCSRELSRKN